MVKCPEPQLELESEGAFLSNGTINITPHRIGLALCGVATLATWAISLSSIVLHLVNYWEPEQQRQLVRILTLPMTYSLCSMLAYFFFEQYEYFELVQALSEGLALASFLMLLFSYVNKADGGIRHEAIASKGKYKAPFPLCCVQYHPYKPAFLNTLKWAVLQYAIVGILSTIVGIITQALEVLCATSNSPKFAEIWLKIISFCSMSAALYALLTFYDLTKAILKGGRNRPTIKFLTIKATVAILFTQDFIISLVAGDGYIPTSPYWSPTAIAHMLVALLTCVEMVFFSLFYMWAFSWKDYREAKPYPSARTPFWKSLGHVVNLSDLFREVWLCLLFFARYCLGRPGTSSKHSKLDPGVAFCTDDEIEKSGSWQMVDRPTMSMHMPSEQDGAYMQSEGEEEEPEVASYRHTLGATTPGMEHLVEVLHDDHYTPAGQRLTVQGEHEPFVLPPAKQHSSSPGLPQSPV